MIARDRIRQVLFVNRWLFVASLLLAGAVYASLRYVTDYMARQTAATTNATTPVLTVSTAMGAYVPISSADVTVKSYPTNLVPPGALTSPNQLTGAWTTEALSPGTPIVPAEIFRPTSSNIIAARISPGDMAIDLPLNAQDSVDGLILPGDHISIFTTIAGSKSTSATVDFLNNVPVLAVNGSLVPASTPTVGQGLTLILALPPRDISALIYAQQQGPLVVALDAPHSTASAPPPYNTSMYLARVP